jgi:murein peptide amidase A
VGGDTSDAFTLGRSAQGRPIRALAFNGFEDHLVLAIGCIHGDECSGIEVGEMLDQGCPPVNDVVFVPNLNPDGLALGTRVNARGVDLNRNFSSGWQADRTRGDPEYPGPSPFSEPETRIARRLIQSLDPAVTIWFHQQAEALVRAWGPSLPAARRYAERVGLPFHRLAWLPGSAPNWQNHRFPGTSSFVVELAPGPLSSEAAFDHASAVLAAAG